MADFVRARQLRQHETWAEKLVWRWLRDRRFSGWTFPFLRAIVRPIQSRVFPKTRKPFPPLLGREGIALRPQERENCQAEVRLATGRMKAVRQKSNPAGEVGC
jgi:hypothetical protein